MDKKADKKAALLLLPNLLGELRHHELFLPPSVDRAVESIDGLIAESAGAGRRYLKRFKTKKPYMEIPLALFNEHTPPSDIDFLLEPMVQKRERWGLIVDAGLPCLADPGALLVRRAREIGLAVQAFVGPSSIVLALMLSGLPSQRFAFYGYLPKERAQRQKSLLQLEKSSKETATTQLFIEAPYRNGNLLEDLLTCLHERSELCIAWDLTLPTQGLLCQTIERWKKSPLPDLSKRVAIFLLKSA